MLASLSAALALVLAFGCGKHTGGDVANVQSTANAKDPRLSKAARKSALQAAADKILQLWAAPIANLAAGPTDETKIPHYFGPWPNWANSPLIHPDATVTITGDGTTAAEATATVGAGGKITGITVTNPGAGYTTATVSITGSGTLAAATAIIQASGGVTGITLNTPGAGYTAPAVSITGGGATVDATATAFGGVDAVLITNGGSGYTFPTVEFDLPNAPDGVQATGHAEMDANGTITAVVVDNSGSGYSTAPGVAIINGTRFDPAALASGGSLAVATTTLALQSIALDTFGTGYTSPPTVAITDSGSGTGADATAAVAAGVIASITIDNPGSGYLTGTGMRKFVDTLPGLGPTGVNNLGQYISVASADTSTFANADYYVIGLVQNREQMHSDLSPTLLREYVQLALDLPVPSVACSAPAHVAGTPCALTNPDGTPILLPNGTQAVALDAPHYLGPAIVAQRNKPVRIVFYNLLPKGSGGDLFLPVDTTMMGSGMGQMGMTGPTDEGTVMDDVRNPMCTEKFADPTMRPMCFTENRATLHLHGGNTPWISDGTPHQWITPAGEDTEWPQGVSVRSVPDMTGAAKPANVPECNDAADGCMTFYYTNQQSARLMFYHDHAWGITRLNVYAGEAAAYLIQDETEKKLVDAGIIPDVTATIPLVIQDRTFVPSLEQLAQQDPTWDLNRWGGPGDLWYHHVYMPAQNPGDPGGMSAYGRWMYGPWFWPPAGDAKHGPIANPYYDPLCNLDDPTTWQYQTDPFCEPELIPGTPNISAGMEQFNDTPVVNGTAYPKTTLEPKTYRFRILNAANDRFWNLQWYVADPTTGTLSEVKLKADEVAAAQLDPVVSPTPDTDPLDPENDGYSEVGPSWIQIGTEGGFLPAPVVVPNQHVTWITDPTRFDVGNVDQHSLLLAPAERADVIVDFSKFAGKTLILYNDAPAAFPARVPSYDYYTGAPDLSPAGAPTIIPGYGPNTRTIMQVTIAAGTPATAFNLAALENAFRHKADGSGVFESGQHPIIVGQAGYNSAYGTSFASAGFCASPSSTNKCDGYARINQQGGDLFTFDTLIGATGGSRTLNPPVSAWQKMAIKIEPKAIHDEMNASSFDDFGRMTANLGVEAVPATPGLQNVVLYPYTSPTTEIVDTTNLPKVQFDANGVEVKVTPIARADDGTQIWKITHNGVDTHPIHFHAYDVQVLNRVTWDNIIIPPDATELGWKDTVRMSPLEDTIVVFRAVPPTLPWDLPNSIRLIDPSMPAGMPIATGLMFGPDGNPVDVLNHEINFGYEYVWHCHILSHEEMDMMRSVSLASPPAAPTIVSAIRSGNGNRRVATVSWMDNSVNETGFEIQRATSLTNANWTVIATFPLPIAGQPVDGSTKGGVMTYVDPIGNTNQNYFYRVRAVNAVGDTFQYADPVASPGTNFPTKQVASAFTEAASWVATTPPAAPSNFSGTVSSRRVTLTWTDNANNESGFQIQWSTNANFTQVTNATATANATTFLTGNLNRNTNYYFRIRATNAAGDSAWVTLPTFVHIP